MTASHTRREAPLMPPQPQRSVLERFPAGGPRGSWPAEEYAAAQRAQGTDAQVVMDLRSDQFLVVTGTVPQ
ncbi:hypothetical protein Save01_06481 [Streptomyces avermitilis]|nr:hypothetical protein SAVMC3_90100 [Streptomyces avermitilis]GDY70414.1 hypothetical protein SAV14893_098070 [Streptomyces avermitilis]GDY80728.1 hypothetical protein SAV31267_102130 [Streptomyces avermitilis]